MRAAAGLILAALAAVPAAAGMPDPGMPEGAVPTHLTERTADAYALPAGPATAAGLPALALRGRVVRRAFRLEAPDASTEAVLAGYRARLAALGFETLLDCRNEGCGGLDFRFGAEILPAPAMVADAGDLGQISARRPGQPAAYVSVLASRALGAVHVQTVAVLADAGTAHPLVASPPAGAVAAAAAVLPPASDTAGLRERLLADGHAAVPGLEFETGGARLSAASRPALERLAALLLDDPSLAVVIVGHSDNQGGLELNRDLSRQRAGAVRDALVGLGVPAARLSAEGVGFLAPVASNATEGGRARNRRVEFVLR